MDYTTTRLLTLLNVSAVKAGKRKWTEDSTPTVTEKLNKRKSARIALADANENAGGATAEATVDEEDEVVGETGDAQEAPEEDEAEGAPNNNLVNMTVRVYSQVLKPMSLWIPTIGILALHRPL